MSRTFRTLRTPRTAALAAFLLAILLPPAVSAAAAAVPFIDDDYPQALAQARARNLPLFLEAWAPWCHSCRSMQAYVCLLYTSPSPRD